MEQDPTKGARPEMEDYGSPSTDYDQDAMSGNKAIDQGKYSGGTAGTQQGDTEGEEFGEFKKTGTGTDLTITMENTDPLTGTVRGGEENADDIADADHYSAEEGEVSSHGHFGGGSAGSVSETPNS
ncbi:MAG: hypothetical protein IVW55_13195 [Chloroflexi bacterium]|nr:hypothetical protein [Chloroflexota bacterium]